MRGTLACAVAVAALCVTGAEAYAEPCDVIATRYQRRIKDAVASFHSAITTAKARLSSGQLSVVATSQALDFVHPPLNTIVNVTGELSNRFDELNDVNMTLLTASLPSGLQVGCQVDVQTFDLFLRLQVSATAHPSFASDLSSLPAADLSSLGATFTNGAVSLATNLTVAGVVEVDITTSGSAVRVTGMQAVLSAEGAVDTTVSWQGMGAAVTAKGNVRLTGVTVPLVFPTTATVTEFAQRLGEVRLGTLSGALDGQVVIGVAVSPAGQLPSPVLVVSDANIFDTTPPKVTVDADITSLQGTIIELLRQLQRFNIDLGALGLGSVELPGPDAGALNTTQLVGGVSDMLKLAPVAEQYFLLFAGVAEYPTFAGLMTFLRENLPVPQLSSSVGFNGIELTGGWFPQEGEVALRLRLNLGTQVPLLSFGGTISNVMGDMQQLSALFDLIGVQAPAQSLAVPDFSASVKFAADLLLDVTLGLKTQFINDGKLSGAALAGNAFLRVNDLSAAVSIAVDPVSFKADLPFASSLEVRDASFAASLGLRAAFGQAIAEPDPDTPVTATTAVPVVEITVLDLLSGGTGAAAAFLKQLQLEVYATLDVVVPVLLTSSFVGDRALSPIVELHDETLLGGGLPAFALDLDLAFLVPSLPGGGGGSGNSLTAVFSSLTSLLDDVAGLSLPTGSLPNIGGVDKLLADLGGKLAFTGELDTYLDLLVKFRRLTNNLNFALQLDTLDAESLVEATAFNIQVLDSLKLRFPSVFEGFTDELDNPTTNATFSVYGADFLKYIQVEFGLASTLGGADPAFGRQELVWFLAVNVDYALSADNALALIRVLGLEATFSSVDLNGFPVNAQNVKFNPTTYIADLKLQLGVTTATFDLGSLGKLLGGSVPTLGANIDFQRALFALLQARFPALSAKFDGVTVGDLLPIDTTTGTTFDWQSYLPEVASLLGLPSTITVADVAGLFGKRPTLQGLVRFLKARLLNGLSTGLNIGGNTFSAGLTTGNGRQELSALIGLRFNTPSVTALDVVQSLENMLTGLFSMVGQDNVIGSLDAISAPLQQALSGLSQHLQFAATANLVVEAGLDIQPLIKRTGAPQLFVRVHEFNFNITVAVINFPTPMNFGPGFDFTAVANAELTFSAVSNASAQSPAVLAVLIYDTLLDEVLADPQYSGCLTDTTPCPRAKATLAHFREAMKNRTAGSFTADGGLPATFVNGGLVGTEFQFGFGVGGVLELRVTPPLGELIDEDEFEFTGTGVLTARVTFGFGLDVKVDTSRGLTNVTLADITVALQNFTMGLEIQADVSATAKIGIISASVSGGTGTLAASFTGSLNGGNPTALADITSSNFAFSKAASLSACLPFSASIGSQDLGQLAGASPGQSPQVCVNDADLFDGTAPTITPLHMDRLFDFKGLTPLQILGIVRGVVNVVQEYRETPVFDLPIPFSDIDLGDMLDFADALSASLMQKMLKAQDVADRTTLVLCVESDALIADWNVAATNGSAAYQAGLSGKIFSVVMNEELQVELEPDVPALQAAVTIGEVVTLLNDALFRAGLGLSVQASQVASGVDAVQLCTNSSVKATDLRVQVALKQTGLAAYTADPTATGANTFLGFTDGDVKEVPRVPAFETIPELVVVLAEAIGVPQGALQVTYADPLGNGQYKLLFKLNLPLVLPAPTATLTLGAEVQPLFEVNASAEIALDTVATIGFELGARMGTTAGNLSLMATPPGGLNNFTLASALSFTLLVDRESFVVPLRAGQRLYDELSLQVAAVVSAGLVSRGKTGITVRVLNYKDSTFLIQTTGAKRLEARTSAAFEAVTGMGSDKSKALLFQPIVRNLNFVADMVLSVTNVNLEATLAVLQATSYGGAGAISLRAMAEFGTPGQTMLLGEIRDAIVEDPFSVVAANATVNAFLDVSVTVTVPKLGLPNFAVEGTVSAALNPPFFVELRPNFTLPNASDFEVSINAPALPNLSNFKNLSLAEIVSLIASGVDLIFGNDAKGVSGLLTGVDVLDLEIPVVSVRPRTVVTQLQTILGELEGLLADPAGGVKRMELLIETKLGLPDDGRADCTGSCLVEFQFSPTDNVFVLKLEYGVAPPSLPQLSLDMNLRELIGLAGITLDTATADALNDFVDLEASLSFAFEGSASATLELGVDLSSWPYRPFIGGETGVQLNLQANATGSLSLSLGPLEFAIENAEVKLDNGVVGAGSGPAFLRFGLQQGDRYYLSDGFSSIISGFDLTHTGIVKANLPIPVLSDTMSVEIPSIVDFLSRSHSGVSSGLVVFQGSPTNLFSSLAFNLTGLNPLAALLTDKEALLKGIEGMFTKVEFAIVGASGVLGSLNAPIVGDKIRTTVATDFLGSFKTQLIGELRAKLNQLTGSDANANVASALRDVMEVLFRDTLGILKGNTIPIIIRDESGVDITSSVLNQTTGIMLPGANLETADSLEWQITLGKDILFNLPFAFDLGVSELPLKLNVDGSVQLLVGWNFNLFFGMSVKRGFFFNVAGTDLEVYAGLTLPGLTAKGSLFILEADVTNIDTVTQLLGRVSVDVADVDGDGFLTFREIKSGGASLISAQASFEASLGMDLSLGLASPGLPRFETQIFTYYTAAWEKRASAGAAAGGLPALPTANGTVPGNGFSNPTFILNDVSLNLGEFVSDILKPIFQKLAGFVGPIKPILDALSKPLPVISDLAKRDVSLLELPEVLLNGLLGAGGPVRGRVKNVLAYVNAIEQIIDLAKSVIQVITDMAGYTGTLKLSFGTWEVKSGGPQRYTGGALPAGFRSVARSAETLADDSKPNSQSSKLGPSSMKSLFGKLTDPNAIFFLPFLSASGVLGLITGKDVDLFVVQTPQMEIDVTIDFWFPVAAGLIVVDFYGSFQFRARISMGYDTSGIRRAIEQNNPLLALDGFFLSDTDLPTGTGGTDIPELYSAGIVRVGATLNVGLAKLSGSGFFSFTGSIDLYDPNADGKIRFSEIKSIIEKGSFLDIFNIKIKMCAGASFSVDVFNPFANWKCKWYGCWPRGEWQSVYRFSASKCFLELDTTPPALPVLANVEGNTLKLNMGSRAGNRVTGNTADGGEYFTIRYVNGQEGTEEVEVLFGVPPSGGQKDSRQVQEFTGFTGGYWADGNRFGDTILLVSPVSSGTFTGGTDQGKDRLIVDLTGRGTQLPSGTLSAGLIRGFGLGASGIAYSNFEEVHLRLNGLADDVTIDGSTAGTTFYLYLNGGNDLVTVLASGSLAGAVRIFGGDGQDSLDVRSTAAATGTLTSTSVTGLNMGPSGSLTFETMEVIRVLMTGAADTFRVVSTPPGASVEVQAGSGGADTIIVGSGSVNNIVSPVKVVGGGASKLVIDDVLDTANGETGELTATRVTGLGLSADGVLYTGFATLDINLATRDGVVFTVTSTHPGLTRVYAGDQADTLVVSGVSGVTEVRGGGGADRLEIPLTRDGDTIVNRISAFLYLDGEGGDDAYQIGFSGTGASRIQLHDDGYVQSNGGETNTLVLDGTPAADTMLFRPTFIALVHTGEAERVDVDRTINGGIIVNGHDGDDTFATDGTSSVVTQNGGAGDDRFLIGQLYNSERVADKLTATSDEFNTTLTTEGYLSDGNGDHMNCNGESGADSFTVMRNIGMLSLRGGVGNDRFTVRAFALASALDQSQPDPNLGQTEVGTDEGNDVVYYTVNAPVTIDGGPGFDTLVAIGTDLPDTFVITRDGIYGAGLYVTFTGVESVELTTGAGDDTIYIMSTADNVKTNVFAGLGSDAVYVTPRYSVPVQSSDLRGHNGLIEHVVSSTADAAYDGLEAHGVTAYVTDLDTASLVISSGVRMQLIESGSSSEQKGTYTVRMVRRLLVPFASSVKINVIVPGAPSEIPGAASVTVSPKVLTFNFFNWNVVRTVTVTVENDRAPEGNVVLFLAHDVVQLNNIDGYDKLKTPPLPVRVVDSDNTELYVVEPPTPYGRLRVSESGLGAIGRTVTYDVLLRPCVAAARPQDVTVNVRYDTAQVTVSPSVLTFSTGSQCKRTVTVTATDDTLVEGFHFVAMHHDVTIAPGNKAYGRSAEPLSASTVNVEILDDDAPGVAVLETLGSTEVVEGDAVGDTYLVYLTQQPQGAVTVDVNVSESAIWGSSVRRREVTVSPAQLTFTSTSYATPATVTVVAIKDNVFDAGETTQQFASQPALAYQIQGPLTVGGGVAPAQEAILKPVMYPGETDIEAFPGQTNPWLTVREAQQVDTLVIENTGGFLPTTVVLSEGRVTGMGMGDTRVLGGETVLGGITYYDFEEVVVNLGPAVDTVLVNQTHAGATYVNGGRGTDTFTVRGADGPVILDGARDTDSFIFGDASGLLGTIKDVVAVAGGSEHDTVLVSNEGGHVLGDAGFLSRTELSGLGMYPARGGSSTTVQTVAVRGTSGVFSLTVPVDGVLHSESFAVGTTGAVIEARFQAKLFPNANVCGTQGIGRCVQSFRVDLLGGSQ